MTPRNPASKILLPKIILHNGDDICRVSNHYLIKSFWRDDLHGPQTQNILLGNRDGTCNISDHHLKKLDKFSRWLTPRDPIIKIFRMGWLVMFLRNDNPLQCAACDVFTMEHLLIVCRV
jgi:hypothetical protein